MFFALSVAALTAVYLLVGKLERLPPLRFRVLTWPRPYLGTDVAWYSMAVAATAVSMFLFRPILSLFTIGAIGSRVGALPLLVQVALGLVVFDLVSFSVHVVLHRSNTLWQLHKVHHSTLELDGLATTRTHMVENLVRFVPGQLVLFLLGVPTSVVAASVALAAVYGVSNHSNLNVRLRWIEVLLVTPRLHRRHHVPATTNSNYGTMFTVWDRLYRSLQRCDTAADERYGAPGEIDTYPQHFADAVREPFRQLHHRRDTRHAV